MSSTFAVVLPYYNEQDFLPRTLRSWLNQARRPDQLILVDNGSTDRSAEICRRLVGTPGDLEVIHTREERAGKTNALETGCARATCDFVVLSDADTWYPPHYIETCARLAAEASPGVVCLMALPANDDPRGASSRLRRGARVALSRVFSRQGFVGGYGQVMRAEALRKAGGFSTRHWNYVLLDHEILNRIFRYGHSLYHMDLWCVPSRRRSDRRRVALEPLRALPLPPDPLPPAGLVLLRLPRPPVRTPEPEPAQPPRTALADLRRPPVGWPP